MAALKVLPVDVLEHICLHLDSAAAVHLAIAADDAALNAILLRSLLLVKLWQSTDYAIVRWLVSNRAEGVSFKSWTIAAEREWLDANTHLLEAMERSGRHAAGGRKWPNGRLARHRPTWTQWRLLSTSYSTALRTTCLDSIRWMSKKAGVRQLNATIATLDMYRAVYPHFRNGVQHKATIAAALNGSLDLIRLLPHRRFDRKVIRAATRSGNLELVKYLHDGCFHHPGDRVWPWVQDAFEQAATDGRIADVERFFQLPHLLQRCSLWGVYHTQHLPVIKLLYPRFTDEGAAWSLQRAASRNHLPIVQYLCDKRPELDVAQALAAAVEMGYLEIVKFLHPRCPAGCSESAVWEALRYERWGVLEYLRDHGNDSFPVLAESLISWNALPGLLHLYPVDRAMHWVKLLHNRDAPGCTSQTMDWAAGKGLLEVVEFLHTHRTEGCTTAAMDQAAAAGHLRVVTFLHNNRTEGCTTAAMDWAAVNGNWDVVQFLHKHRTEGCTFRGLLHTFTSGNLQMVKFLCRHRPETQTMNDMTPNWYYVNNLSDLVILRYYYGSRSSPVDNAAFAHAARAGRLELVKLMYEAKFCDDIEQAMQGARFSRRRQVLQYLEGILAQRK
ncbi:hypothetical protein RI367_004983 [Sorochytrium milnesiophthora]